jgi:hypothetical protein
MLRNNSVSESGEQDAPKSPTGITFPVQDKTIPQENTDEDLHLTCRKDPMHTDEWRCKPVPGPVTPKTVSSVTSHSEEQTSQKSDDGNLKTTPDGDGVEVWNRSNGETLHVKRIEWEGRELYLPIAATSQPQPVDPQSPLVKTAKQDPKVGRTQTSPCGSGSKRSCPLPSSRLSARAKQDDQARRGP